MSTGTMSTGAAQNGRITLQHGAGSRAMRELIQEVFAPQAASDPARCIGLDRMDDGAAIRLPFAGGDRWLILTTDSHVVHPIFFPGGDIGRLAVAGTVNDLSMMGATELLGLTCSVIVEAGFPRSDLERVQASIRATCEEAGVEVLTGDTKVMGPGEVDGVVLNTTGIALTDRVVTDDGLRPGDRLILSGRVGDHGLAILVARAGLDLEGDLRSDTAPLQRLIAAALEAGGEDIVAMKDPTRGGVASALCEMASKSAVGIVLDEPALPLSDEVRAASELLGIDPLQVANEGKALIGVRPEAADRVLDALRADPLGEHAAIVGACTDEHVGSVVLGTGFGRRLLTELDGEPLPRIC